MVFISAGLLTDAEATAARPVCARARSCLHFYFLWTFELHPVFCGVTNRTPTPVKKTNNLILRLDIIWKTIVSSRSFILAAFMIAPCLQSSAQIPIINSFSPLSAKAGTVLTINGNNFNAVAANNTVRFGTVKAAVIAASATTLQVIVPAQASYARVSVTNNNLTGWSAQSFSISFDGAGTGFYANSFSEKTDSALGGGAGAVGSTDIDNDGRTDIAVLQTGANKVFVYRNTGSIGAISFAAKVSFSTGKSASAIAFADIDGDGNEDLIIANAGDSSVAVCRNTSSKGLVSFSAAVNFNTGGACMNVIARDFNNDGRVDLALVNTSTNTIAVLTNNSSGNGIDFLVRQLYATGNSPVSISAADLDGDNQTDLAVANAGASNFSVFKNTSAGAITSFAAKTDYTLPYTPIAIAVADLDADNKPEIAVTYAQLGSAVIMPNTSTGSTISFGTPETFPIGNISNNIAAADMNGDGKPDIITYHGIPSGICVLRNKSVPGNIDFGMFVNYPATGNPGDMVQNDLDGDSRPDIVAAPFGTSVLEIMRNTVPYPFIAAVKPDTAGNGSVVTVTGYNFNPGSSISFGGTPPLSFSVDSLTSISAVMDTGSSGKIKVSNGYGAAEIAGFIFTKKPQIVSFSPAVAGRGTEILIQGINFTGTTAVSFGGNPAAAYTVLSPGLIKATVGNIGTGTFIVAVTNPSGTTSLDGLYTGPTIKTISPLSGPAGSKVVITGERFSNSITGNIVYFGAAQATVSYADSGRIEATVPAGASFDPPTVTANNLTAFATHPFVVSFATTGQAFTPSSFAHVADSVTGNFPIAETIADFNNDGKNDIAAANFAGSIVSVLQNTSTNGSVSFLRKKDYPVANYPRRIATGDLDGDGKKDLVAAIAAGNDFTDSIAIFRNTSNNGGAISFDNRQSFYIGYETNPEGVTTGDFDGDGKPDLVVVDLNIAIVLKNTSTPGNISFGTRTNFYFYSDPFGVVVRDMDKDGKPDIVITGDAGITILKNTSSGGVISFTTLTAIYSGGWRFLSVAVGDLDNDGLFDLAVSNGGNSLMAVYKNTSAGGVISFAAPLTFYQDQANGNIAIGDLNGDGKPDIAVLSSDDISVFRNNCSAGSFSFGTPVVYAAPYGISASDISIADMNGDGKPDIELLSSTNNGVSIYANTFQGIAATLPLTIKGTSEICSGDSVLLQTTEVAGASYQWYKDNIALTTSINAACTATAAGSYTVVMTSSGVTTSSAAVNITVKSLPAPPVITAANGLLCQDHDQVLSSSVPVNNQWYLNNTLLTGATANSYRTAVGGSYTVVTNINGCYSPPSAAKLITLIQRPQASISPAGPITICGNDSTVLNAMGGTNLIYQWTVADNPLPGATAPNFTVYNPGVYKVLVDITGCSSLSSPVIVITNAQPLKPTITLTGSILSSSATAGNQWYRNGSPIAGANSATYQPADAASYSVTVTAGGCSSPMSDAINYTVTGIVTIDNTHFISLNPNPARDFLRLSFNLSGTATIDMMLIDMEGRILGEWKKLPTGSTVGISNLPAGMFYAIVQNANGKAHYTFKVIKQ